MLHKQSTTLTYARARVAGPERPVSNAKFQERIATVELDFPTFDGANCKNQFVKDTLEAEYPAADAWFLKRIHMLSKR